MPLGWRLARREMFGRKDQFECEDESTEHVVFVRCGLRAPTIARRTSDDLLRYPATQFAIQSSSMGSLPSSRPALWRLEQRAVDAGDRRIWIWRLRPSRWLWTGTAGLRPAIRSIWWPAFARQHRIEYR